MINLDQTDEEYATYVRAAKCSICAHQRFHADRTHNIDHNPDTCAECEFRGYRKRPSLRKRIAGWWCALCSAFRTLTK